MKKDITNYNSNTLLSVLFAASVGVILLLIFALLILHRYRKWKFGKRDKEENCDLEKLIPDQVSETNQNRTSIYSSNVSSHKKIKTLIRGSHKGNRFGDEGNISRIYTPSPRKEKEYSCENNNTCCSSNKRKIGNISKIGCILDNRSLDDCLHKEDHSIPSQSQIQMYKIQRFSPLCTSSPLPRTNSVTSTNDTFSICKDTGDIYRKGNLRTPDNVLNVSRAQYFSSDQSTPNTTSFSQLKSPVLHSKSSENTAHSYMLNTNDVLYRNSANLKNYNIALSKSLVCNLLNHKCDEDESESENLLNSQKNVYPSRTQNSNNEVVWKTFGNTGNISYKSMSPQYTEKILFHGYSGRVIIDNRPHLIIHAIYPTVVWFTQRYFLNSVFAFNCLETGISQIKKSATVTIYKTIKTEKIKIRNINKNYSNIISLVEHSFSSSILPAKELVANSTTLRDNDNSWKGRSRMTIKR